MVYWIIRPPSPKDAEQVPATLVVDGVAKAKRMQLVWPAHSCSAADSAVIPEKDQGYFVSSLNLTDKALAELKFAIRNRLRDLGASRRAGHLGGLG